MNNYWILLIPIVIIIGLFVKWMSDSAKDFSDIIELELKTKGIKFISSKYPGLFKVGPFKKFEVSIGKPQINDGAIQYENTYYRIVKIKTKNNKTKEIWAKIDTSWFKDTKIEFNPNLSEIKK